MSELMNTLAKSFAKGLLVLVPILVTLWVVWFVVSTLDGWLHFRTPGVGLVLTLGLITAVGFGASARIGQTIFGAIEKAVCRLPVVKLVYASLKDLLNAFVGDKRTFNKPVLVDLMPENGIKVLGFVTCESFADSQLTGHMAVYLPQSYNFAGNLVVVPKERVRTIDADGAQFMAFIVSGGVAEMNAARTITDMDLPELSRGKRSK